MLRFSVPALAAPGVPANVRAIARHRAALHLRKWAFAGHDALSAGTRKGACVRRAPVVHLQFARNGAIHQSRAFGDLNCRCTNRGSPPDIVRKRTHTPNLHGAFIE